MALVINGQRIDDAVVDNEFSQIKAYHENLGNVSCCERDEEFRGYAKNNVVARVLLAQEAGRVIAPTPDAEVDAAVEKLKEEYGGEGWFYSRTGLTPETLHLVRHDLDLDLRVKQMLEQLTSASGEPSEADLRRHYEQHIADFMTAEQVRASHILKNPARAEDRDPAYASLRDLRRQILAGADFESLAREHSDKAAEHIDLGWFKKGEIAPEFEAVAMSMEVGEVSPIFVSPYGFHLVKLTERKPSVPRPFDEARADVERHLREHRKADATRKLVEELKAKATIEEAEEMETVST